MRFYSTLILALIVVLCFGQSGKLMLVGGGSESSSVNSWSNTPYQWSIDQSENKRVAIITYDLAGDETWLPNYFLSLGANEAVNIEISTRTLADTQSLYDQLMSFDVFFFKGGDQSVYYELYRDTKVSEAIQDKFDEGGVIAGTSAGLAILSGVIHSAEGASVYPDDVLSDIWDTDITLRNDFAQLLPGYIADSHFIERGRFARLIGFLGRWNLDTDQFIGGIGVDDKTAFCIDENQIGTAYGTGAVSIYTINEFSASDGLPTTKGANVKQLLHGASINLTSSEISTNYSQNTSSTITQESGNYHLFLSGTQPIAHNSDLINEFTSLSSTSVIIVSSQSSSSIVNFYKGALESRGKTVSVITPIMTSDCIGAEIRNSIRSTDAFLFVDNAESSLITFLTQDPTGQILNQQIRRNGAVSAFIGQDARLAGSQFCTNNLTDALNAYYGDLSFASGIGLLASSVIIPEAFSSGSTDFYENNSAAVFYALTNYHERFGLLIQEKSYVYIGPNQSMTTLSSTGDFSTVIIENTSTNGENASQPVNSSGDIRNVVGFDDMLVSLLGNASMTIGSTLISEDPDLVLETISPTSLNVESNTEGILLSWDNNTNQLYDELLVFRKTGDGSFEQIANLSGSENTYLDNVSLDNIHTYYVISVVNSLESCPSAQVTTQNILSSSSNQVFSIYPNPLRGDILYLKNVSASKLRLINLQGEILKTWDEINREGTLNLPPLANGLYVLEFFENEKRHFIKLLKNNINNQ